MQAPAPDLTSVSAVREYADIKNSTDDSMVSRVVTANSRFVMNYLNRPNILSTNYSETYPGNGSTVMVLKNYPINSVSSLVVSGQVVSASVDKLLPGFYFDDIAVYLAQNFYAYGVNSVPYRFALNSVVVVAYNAGYLEVPPEIEQVVIELCAMTYWYRKRQGKRSEALAGQTTSWETAAMTEKQKLVLAQFKRVVPV